MFLRTVLLEKEPIIQRLMNGSAQPQVLEPINSTSIHKRAHLLVHPLFLLRFLSSHADLASLSPKNIFRRIKRRHILLMSSDSQHSRVTEHFQATCNHFLPTFQAALPLFPPRPRAEHSFDTACSSSAMSTSPATANKHEQLYVATTAAFLTC